MNNSNNRILIVEDEALIALAKKAELEQYGYVVSTVLDGPSAIDLVLSSDDIDLVLMDIDLGGDMDGPMAAQSILEKKEIPVIFVSSHAEAEVVKKTEAITSYGYVVKSSCITVLDASIKMAFRLFEEKKKVKEHQAHLEELNKALRESIGKQERIEAALEKRIIALTQPIGEFGNIAFSDLFNIDELQKLQDEFARATGVASVITDVEGVPITEPGNFCRLCKDIIRKTERGRLNCYRSDAIIGKKRSDGPTVQPCLSGGLWDAGAAISVGGKHIANWLIGQVRDEARSEDEMREYAREIGADEQAVVEAFREVPSMSVDKFREIAQMLFTLANLMSNIAFQNVQQARSINASKQVEKRLLESEQKFRSLYDNINLGVALHEIITDEQGKPVDFRWLDVNRAYEELTHLSHGDVVGRTAFEVIPELERKWIDLYGKVALSGKPASIVDHSEYLDKYWDVKAYSPAPGQFAVAVTDITDKKRAEMELSEAYHEKKILLNELQHRAKNSFNLILSMINLMGRAKGSAEVSAALSEISRRVMAISEMYTLLFSNNIVSEVRLDEYLPRVVDPMLHISEKIKLDASYDPVVLSVKKAVCIGIIAVELVTNALKYAFPDGREGVISITLKRDELGIGLIVSDNGVGLPVGLDLCNTQTMGLILVRAMTQQVNGDFHVNVDHGVLCRLHIAC